MAFFIEIDGVVVRAVRFQHCFQLRPDGVMAALVLLVRVGVHLHDEGFTDHKASR